MRGWKQQLTRAAERGEDSVLGKHGGAFADEDSGRALKRLAVKADAGGSGFDYNQSSFDLGPMGSASKVPLSQSSEFLSELDAKRWEDVNANGLVDELGMPADVNNSMKDTTTLGVVNPFLPIAFQAREWRPIDNVPRMQEDGLVFQVMEDSAKVLLPEHGILTRSLTMINYMARYDDEERKKLVSRRAFLARYSSMGACKQLTLPKHVGDYRTFGLHRNTQHAVGSAIASGSTYMLSLLEMPSFNTKTDDADMKGKLHMENGYIYLRLTKKNVPKQGACWTLEPRCVQTREEMFNDMAYAYYVGTAGMVQRSSFDISSVTAPPIDKILECHQPTDRDIDVYKTATDANDAMVKAASAPRVRIHIGGSLPYSNALWRAKRLVDLKKAASDLE